ncbi:hypothetical protein DYQ86_16190 [Acidobacteria bacterium AB60]|nr:hypothetical protein DYQ86_16190 [Acidobacteria bacterium AB60]
MNDLVLIVIGILCIAFIMSLPRLLLFGWPGPRKQHSFVVRTRIGSDTRVEAERIVPDGKLVHLVVKNEPVATFRVSDIRFIMRKDKANY